MESVNMLKLVKNQKKKLLKGEPKFSAKKRFFEKLISWQNK
jgi:hypothetical protein